MTANICIVSDVILIVAFQMEQHHSAPSCQRGDLKTPLHSSTTDAQRDTELTRVNGKLYTIAKSQSDKSCPAVANASPFSGPSY